MDPFKNSMELIARLFKKKKKKGTSIALKENFRRREKKNNNKKQNFNQNPRTLTDNIAKQNSLTSHSAA